MTRVWIVLALLIATLNVLGNADVHEPPRFDGAGYAVLAKALAEGQGYREISHPDRPPHDHFPPGYPLTLAALWRSVGIAHAEVSAHALSICCTVAAVGVWGWSFRRSYGPAVSGVLTLALAANWVWGRLGSAIQSEALFFLLTACVFAWRGRVRSYWGMAGLGVLLGACVLTRQAAVALVGAVLVDLLLDRPRRWRSVALVVCSATLVILPWLLWQLDVRRHPQASLWARGDLALLVGGQSLFYVRRIPDQIIGPFVEVATVFSDRAGLSTLATGAALLATGLVLWGWWRLVRSPRRRLLGLWPLATLLVLLPWPFTEAGRFLAPLIPCLIVGTTEGIASLFASIRIRSARRWAAVAVLVASVPYSAYALLAQRADAQRGIQADFDAACRFLRDDPRPGMVLTRHPGDVYWLTGRPAMTWAGTGSIDDLIRRDGATFLLVESSRYAREDESPLAAYVRVALADGRVERVWEGREVAVHFVRRSDAREEP